MIRTFIARDFAAWRVLWDGYCAFYETEVPEQVTAATWQAALDPSQPIIGRAALDADQRLTGFSLSVIHPSTWRTEPSCYLEDLFVDDACRGRGIGRELIEDLIALSQARGWNRLYWHTRAGNAVARRLYDRFTAADDFVRYRLDLQ